MIKHSHFEKLYRRTLDTHEEMMEMFTPYEIEAINDGKVWIVYATDKMFSGWGMSKGKNNHVFVVCFSQVQADAIYDTFFHDKNMARPGECSIEWFHKVRKTGTWSIKNANDCTAWNKGITINVEV